MVRPGRDRLSGTVEVDETYVGAPEEGVRGRETQTKALVVVAAQEDGRGIGRIRMRRIADASAESVIPFVEESIQPGSVVHTVFGGVARCCEGGACPALPMATSSAPRRGR